ncbi:hypothetical protein MNEG_8921, partial [Monoraphidium neglectum]
MVRPARTNLQARHLGRTLAMGVLAATPAAAVVGTVGEAQGATAAAATAAMVTAAA